MSLDQLPDELIAHIGSFLDFDNNCQFGLSQKRIHNVLKRDGLNKPECDKLKFEDDCYDIYYQNYDKRKWNNKYPQFISDGKVSTVQGEIMNKFRRIGLLKLENKYPMGENELKDLLNCKVEIEKLEIQYAEVVPEHVNLFVSVCKKYKNVLLFMPDMPVNFYTDDIFVAILPFTDIQNIRDIEEYKMFDGYGLTDRTLEALTFPNRRKYFNIHHMYTSFTIEGIRAVVEKVIEKAVFVVYLDLGILKFGEEKKVKRWMEENNSNRASKYIVERKDPIHNPAHIFNYNVYRVDHIHSPQYSIYFAINSVEV